MYRLRNQADLDAILEEVSAIYEKNTLYQLYRMATDEPYSFLYIKLTARDKNDMFYMRFDRKLIPN